jgi:hypothetical protein
VVAVHPGYVDGSKSLLEVRTTATIFSIMFALPTAFAYFVIDAIYIDQTSLNERGHQVRMMDVIYENASSVVVHLGEYSDGVQLSLMN